MSESAGIVKRVFGKWWGYMSCAIWTFFGFYVLSFSPTSKLQVRIYFLLAAASLLFALCQTIYIQHRELIRLKSIPPEIALSIHEVVLHRTGDEEWRWKNGEFLVQVSAELLNLPSATVEYSAQLVFRGDVIELATIRDIDRWEIIERKYYQQLYPNTPSMSRPRKDFTTNPAAIAENLTRSIRNEGWLHFQIEGMGESDIAKRTLRLYARSMNGSTHRDEGLAQHHVVRSDLVAMRKYFPKPQRVSCIPGRVPGAPS
jgi:hypothetical protein